jgi:hypothetical protein
MKCPRSRDIRWCTNKRGGFLTNTLMEESERGQVVIAESFLDSALKECFLARFCSNGIKPKTKQNKEFLGNLIISPKSILYNFGAKITVARAFGVIGDQEYKALNAVRQIRNKFSHGAFKLDLSDSEVAEWVNELRVYLSKVKNKMADQGCNNVPLWKTALEMSGIYVDRNPSNHHVFLGAVISLYISISVAKDLFPKSRKKSAKFAI